MVKYLCSILIFLISSFGYADTVWMKNGDLLTGAVVLLNNNKLVFKTDYAGEITLDWKKVATLKTTQKLTIKSGDTQWNGVIEEDQEGYIQIDHAGQSIALKNVAQIFKTGTIKLSVIIGNCPARLALL